MLPKLAAPQTLHKNCEIEPPNWSSVHPNSPPSHSIEHAVSEGESLLGIANYSKYQAGLANYRKSLPEHYLQDLSEEMANARALLVFNYGTVTPEYVNWYLLNVNGCYHATEDKCNRRFSNFDKDSRSPKYGIVKRAGKVYLPKEAVKHTPKALPDVRKVNMWARLRWQDGLFKWLSELAGGIGFTGTLADALEEILKRSGTSWTPEQLRKVAKLKRFVRPLRHALKILKYGGWALTVADLILGGRVITGYLVMTYDEPFDTHIAWEVDMVLKGTDVFGENSGAFTTDKDPYSIRTSVFDPEHQWGEKKLSATMTGGSFALSVLDALKKAPNAKDPAHRAFAGSRFVMPRPGPRDWTLSMKSLHSLGGGLGFFHTLPFLTARLHDGKKRSFTSIMGV